MPSPQPPDEVGERHVSLGGPRALIGSAHTAGHR